MSVMNDLKQAIYDVLESSKSGLSEYDLNRDDGNVVVSRELMRVLQAEYNIYFTELDEPQVSLV